MAVLAADLPVTVLLTTPETAEPTAGAEGLQIPDPAEPAKEPLQKSLAILPDMFILEAVAAAHMELAVRLEQVALMAAVTAAPA